MSLLSDREEQDHVQADKNIWNDNGGIPKAARKNIRLILKSGKIQLGTKHTAFEKSSSSSSSEGESSSGARKGCRKVAGKMSKKRESWEVVQKTRIKSDLF